MDEKQNPQKNAKIEIRRAPNALKIVLIILIIFSTAALVALRWVHNGITAEIDKLKQEAAVVEFANDGLDQRTKSVDSVQSIQDISQEELGLVDPDSIIINPQ